MTSPSSPNLSDEDPGHKAYQAAIAAGKGRGATNETPSLPEGRSPELVPPDAAEASGSLPPLGPGVDVPAADEASGSPLSVREHMARLVVTASKLGAEVSAARGRADAATAEWRQLRDELEETTRVLKAFERIRTPRRRKQ